MKFCASFILCKDIPPKATFQTYLTPSDMYKELLTLGRQKGHFSARGPTARLWQFSTKGSWMLQSTIVLNVKSENGNHKCPN